MQEFINTNQKLMAGAGARASMAKVILGGQMLSLLLSLLITPVAYSLWDDLTQGLSRIFRKKQPTTMVPASVGA